MAETGDLQRIIQAIKDDNSDSIVQIDHYHSETHSGKAYKACFTSSGATNSTTLYMQINGSSSYEGHLQEFRSHVSEGFLDVKFIECSTSSTHVTGDASITAYNRKRSSTNTSVIGFFSNPTLVNSTASGNTVIDRFQIGGTGGSAQQSASNETSTLQDEWVIGNSTYIISITVTTTAASCYVNGCILFYEE